MRGVRCENFKVRERNISYERCKMLHRGVSCERYEVREMYGERGVRCERYKGVRGVKCERCEVSVRRNRCKM